MKTLKECLEIEIKQMERMKKDFQLNGLSEYVPFIDGKIEAFNNILEYLETKEFPFS